jgi:uncharacterized membrane protein YGL010W
MIAMKSFIEQAQFYWKHHQKPVTLYTHLVGIPLIIFSLMLLLSFMRLVIPEVIDISFASIATILLLIYYFFLNWRLALPLTPVLIFILWLADLVSHNGPRHSSLWVFLLTFIIGWIFQLVGHLFEGKRPVITENPRQALISPLFLTAELFFLGGRMQKLKEQIRNEPSEPEKTKNDDKDTRQRP